MLIKIVFSVNIIVLLLLVIERKLVNFKINKVIGLDDILLKIVKEVGDVLLILLMFFYNMSLKDGYVFS